MKYFPAIKNTWSETLAYRMNFVMWRVRVVISLITIYYFWVAVIPSGQNILGYTQGLMLTYIIGTYFINSIVISSRSAGVGDEINQGNLSNYLLRPMNYFAHWFARDLGDKAMNVAVSVIELAILYLILRPPLFLQTDALFLTISLFSVFVALVLYFFFNLLLGMIAFWSPEVWAPRFIFFILFSFFAGSLFPLDMLPENIYSVFKFLPFTYMLYFPVKIYLGQLAWSEIFTGVLISLVWTFLMYQILMFVWRRGLRIYTAVGR